MIDKKMYKITINGIAANSNVNNNITQLIKNIIRIIFSLFFQFSPFFTFRESKGSLATRSRERIIDVPMKNLLSVNGIL